MTSKLTQDSESGGSNWLLEFSLFSTFSLCLNTDWVDASLTIWLSFPTSVPRDSSLFSAMALYLIHRRDPIIIHGNTGVITCSELLGTLVNARRNVRIFQSSKSLWCRWGNTKAFKSRTFNTSQRISLPFPECLSNVCNVQTGWEPLRVWQLVMDKTWVLSFMTKGCWKWSVGKSTC